MFGSTARCVWILAAVATAGCGFKQSNVQPGGSGGGGTGGGLGGIGGGAGTTGLGGRGGMPIVIVTGGLTGADGGSASGTLDSNCGVKTQSAKMIPPDIMLVMDRSLSMTNDVNDKQCAGATGNNGNCGANSKWELMVPALNQVITNTDAKVNWGMFYLGDEPAQCGVATAPVVPVAATNATAITTSLTGNQFNGQTGTPTRRAIQGAVSYLNGLTDTNPKFLLLATDGQPNCATTAASSLNMDDSAGTQQAVADALTAGIPTFVVGIGNTGAAATLDQVAIAGGRPQTGGGDLVLPGERCRSAEQRARHHRRTGGELLVQHRPRARRNHHEGPRRVRRRHLHPDGCDQRLVVQGRHHDDHHPQRGDLRPGHGGHGPRREHRVRLHDQLAPRDPKPAPFRLFSDTGGAHGRSFPGLPGIRAPWDCGRPNSAVRRPSAGHAAEPATDRGFT